MSIRGLFNKTKQNKKTFKSLGSVRFF